ncbi:D-amino acid oxidase [Vermiconidia calcicola]|uniref:D-amino acid oxidase n=1 Tax=Vermiconidia calcicola TaxID=1690605 RepID=A0ACC3MHK9_9PEZI|nr:D-amino acid oxidase [Vermiconidia calcicola]
MASVVVLGAGVSGLTTALQLARNGNNSITLVAKHMPGDYDIEYASPWAGANYLPNLAALHVPSIGVGAPGSNHKTFEINTWPELSRLASDHPEVGIHFQEARVFRRAKDAGSATAQWFAELLKEDAWFKEVVPNFKVLPQSELPPGMDGGTSFTSVCINTALYLPWLASQCLKLGVKLRRGIATHVADAADMHHSGKRADLVVNCTGLSSLFLGGVEDAALYPGRGQIVLVRNEAPHMYSTSGTDDGSDEAMYIMHRAAGGGCILGGCMQAGNWESQPDPSLATRIMKRCVDICPELVTEGKGIEGLSIVRHGVGLRPMRNGSIRVESEIISGVAVVHNYGHGGYGYQTSYGAAQEAERLVKEALREKARL